MPLFCFNVLEKRKMSKPSFLIHVPIILDTVKLCNYGLFSLTTAVQPSNYSDLILVQANSENALIPVVCQPKQTLCKSV